MSKAAPSEALPSSSIFRTEAIEGLRTRYGRPVPLFGLRSWTIVTFMVAMLFAVGIFLFTSKYSREETVPGLLQPTSGSASIVSSRNGRIAEVYVREGQFVREGQPLMRISVDQALDQKGGSLGNRLSAANEMQSVQLEAAQSAVSASNAARREELRRRISGARSQVAYLRQSLVLAQQRQRLEQENLDGMHKLAERGFAPSMQVRAKEAEMLGLLQGAAETERQIAQIESDIQAMEAAQQQALADSDESTARLRVERAALDERKAQTDAESGFELLAPYAGRVVTMRTTVGTTVDPSMTLATVLPRDGQLEAILWVPSRAIGFVKPGDDVRLMFDPFPFERFGTGKGVVQAISSTPVDADEVPALSGGQQEALYRVRVGLREQSIAAYGKEWPLMPGSRVRADLILERQSLIDWLLNPVRAFQQRSV